MTDAELLKKAERLWEDLQKNQLGGFSGINRPFWIMYVFKEIRDAVRAEQTGSLITPIPDMPKSVYPDFERAVTQKIADAFSPLDPVRKPNETASLSANPKNGESTGRK